MRWPSGLHDGRWPSPRIVMRAPSMPLTTICCLPRISAWNATRRPSGETDGCLGLRAASPPTTTMIAALGCAARVLTIEGLPDESEAKTSAEPSGTHEGQDDLAL